MRKIKYLIITLLLVILPVKVFASGGVSVSTGSLSIKKGSSATFTITANNAAGKINISSSNGAVATVSSSSEFLDMQSATITVTGVSVGTATITVYNADVTTYDDEDITGQSRTIAVNVYESSNSANTNTNTNTQKKNNYSTNNKLKSISVEGYELEKISDNSYKLNVKNNVTSIVINAEAEDGKAKITGTGEHEINVGDNNIEVIVTSESGAQNKINILVNRKDGYTIEDIDDVLSSNENDVSITLNEDITITSDFLNKVKSSGKVVTLNKFDENKKLLYSWTLDGSKISDTTEFNPNINFVSNNSDNINNLANYASGMYINLEHDGVLPKGTKVKVNVSDKYNDGDKVNIYYYNEKENKLEMVSEALVVTGGCIEMELEHESEYFATMSTVNAVKTTSSVNYLAIILIIETILFAAVIVLDILGKNPLLKIIHKGY